MNRVELLRRVSIFGALKPETLEFLLARATDLEAEPGAEIVAEGEPGGDVCVIETGSAAVVKRRSGGGEGDSVHLAELRPGDCFGETSLLGILPRSASVVAREAVTGFRLRNADLLALHEHDVAEFAMLVMNLGREIARRLYLTNELVFARMTGGQT